MNYYNCPTLSSQDKLSSRAGCNYIKKQLHDVQNHYFHINKFTILLLCQNYLPVLPDHNLQQLFLHCKYEI